MSNDTVTYVMDCKDFMNVKCVSSSSSPVTCQQSVFFLEWLFYKYHQVQVLNIKNLHQSIKRKKKKQHTKINKQHKSKQYLYEYLMSVCKISLIYSVEN